MKLKELEKRLEKEPGNLGLRVTVAGLMREAGRSVEAVELYRSVAIAYRDQGRVQQAIAVCRAILEIAPDDVRCQGLLGSMQAPIEGTPPPPAPPAPAPKTPPPLRQGQPTPARPSPSAATPLPAPVPHHVFDPTSRAQKLPASDLADDHDTHPGERTPVRPRVLTPSTGLAQAASRITGMMQGDLAAELDTRPRAKIDDSATMRKISQPPPTVPVPQLDPADLVTPPKAQNALSRDSEDELTQPRDKLPEHDEPTKRGEEQDD